MGANHGGFAGEVTVTVLIPAHNEEASLPQTIASLKSQSHRPDRIIVVADNCTDATIRLAHEAGDPCRVRRHQHGHLRLLGACEHPAEDLSDPLDHQPEPSDRDPENLPREPGGGSGLCRR
ncbi:glycosyltransferase [Arthrobacter cheniae]|uniref:Glycosyltransferase n=1 Tax=Arthrobacter cheniae TaxID=1258888 RepID=A0A3A5MJM7_9MICC|nr:glycosyltransferase [Arthrobacter cheniae]RJT83434.1 glycosyltransferase [Arthrobacter cheniae]